MTTPNVLVLCDNDWIGYEIKKIFYSKNFPISIESSDLYDDLSCLIGHYDLIISAHCKKIFNKELIDTTRIINIHPGLNPYNRGMYPHIFSIINGLPTGATIHEVDEKIDNGDIIYQKDVIIHKYDDSKSLHERIMKIELELFESNFNDIIFGTYTKTKPSHIGNINYKSDFEQLREINLSDYDTFENHINKLRAMTYGDYKNTFFYDKDGSKIYVKIQLSK
jgi:methionyl-tRNA formyltransferase